MLDWLDRGLSRITSAVAVIGAVGIVVLMLITTVAVFWRYVVDDPIYGIGDLSVLTLSVVSAAAVSYGARHNAHVSVNVITYLFGRKITRWIDVLMRSLALGILVIAAYALVSKACGFEKACITVNLSIEHRPFFYVLAASMAFFAVHVLWQLLVGLRHFNDSDPNEPGD